jgi:2-C-methyl-D-erythritol 4-phosphate cytidylyltransferase|tara:strand:- start:944 stop:1648 length:705 start_codon:yes stop_codon:yes gene_type:complete
MNTMPKCWAVIPAAGIGQRVGSKIPKQYLQIAGKTILEHSITPLIDNNRIAGVTVVLHPQDTHFADIRMGASDKIRTVIGGATRAHSVLNALKSFETQLAKDDFVLVHDAARPCLTSDDLNRLINLCLDHEVGGIIGSRVTDTIKQVEDNNVVNTLDRENIWRAYTPQMFKFGILQSAIQKAFEDNVSITDEASAIEYAGYQPCMVEGDVRNIKVTTAEDISLAEIFLQEEFNL